MFTIHTYLNKLYDIQWYFHDNDKNELEHILYVGFEKVDDHYKIKQVHYTYVDILLGLEHIDFELIKTKNAIKIKML